MKAPAGKTGALTTEGVGVTSVQPQKSDRAVFYDRPWIAMNAAHVRAEAAISTRNGLTVDFADFAIAALRWCQVKLWPNWLAQR